jgi:hypothetical protein
MINTRLQIGTENYAIVNNIPISTNFVQADLREPDKRNASFTKTITLYGNNKLNKLFENIFEANIDLQSFNPNLKETAKYFVDETQVLTGALQLLKITKTPDNNIVYECSIIGNEGNLFVDIGDKYLEELDFSEYDHDYTRANQIASWTNNCKVSGVSTNVGMGKGYYYGFVQRGLGTNSDSVFSVKEFFPQLFVREYLEKIFAQGGYTWDSDFLDSDEFKKLIVEPNISALQMTQSQLDNAQINVGVPSIGYEIYYTNPPWVSNGNYQFIPYLNESYPFFDPSNQWNTDGFGTDGVIQKKGYYNINHKIKIKISFDHTNPLVDTFRLYSFDYPTSVNEWTFETVILRNGSILTTSPKTEFYITEEIITYTNGSTSTVTHNLATSQIQFFIGSRLNPNVVKNEYYAIISVSSGEVLLNKGDVISTKARYLFAPAKAIWSQSSTGTDITGMTGGTIITKVVGGAMGSNLSMFVTRKEIVEGGTLDPSSAIPKQIKQKDFVKSIMQAFNLYLDFDKNNPKKIIIESYNDYFNYGASVDWSNKIDLDKPIDINPISMVDGKRYFFRYKADKDFYNQKYLDRYAETFGTQRIDIDNDFKKEDKINELIFSPTPNVANDTLRIAVPKIYKDQNGSNTTPNIRLLYAGGVKQAYAPITYKQTDLADYNTINYAYCGHTDDAQTPTVDLNFGIPKEIFYIYAESQFTNNNLYNRYHKNFILNVTSKNSKVMTAYLWLSPLDIKTFSFRKKYFIDNAYYIVNKIIDYNPYETQSTKVELIKILNTDLFTPTSEFFYSNPSIPAGDDVKIAVDQSSANYSENSINMGLNSVAIGEGIFIPATATNVLVNAQNVTIGENVSNVTVINTNNITVTESNVSYINGVYYPTYTILSGGLDVDADVNVLSGGLNSNLQNSILIDGN